jgi:HEAT repeat protein
MTRALMFAATAAGGALLVAATVALTPDFSVARAQSRPAAQQPGVNERASVAAVIASARGANPLMCALAARAIDQSFHWGDFRPGYDPRGLEARAVRETLRVTFDPLRDPQIVATLAPALRDGDACVRRLAAPLLGRLRHPRALAALRQAAREASPQTRETAALGMGFGGDVEAVTDLVQMLRDATPEVRVAAAWALGEIESRSAIQPLVSSLDDADPRVRATSAWALGRIEAPEAVAVLARTLRRDTDPDVRRNAAWALGKVDP